MRIAVFLIILLANFQLSKSQSHAISSYIATTEGKLQTGNSLAQLQETSWASCALHCIRRRTCASVNYDTTLQKCFLMPDNGAREFEEADGFVFMDVLGTFKEVMEGTTQESPTTSCKTLKSKYPHLTSGVYWLDPDLGSHDNAFRAHCDMETAGGGWTLVWSYTFRDYDDFDSANNAVTPVPNKFKDVYSANVPSSTTIPLGEDQFDAADFKLWKQIGRDFLIKSNVNNWLACSPVGGSFVDWVSGSVSCKVVKVVASSCSSTTPAHFSTKRGVSGPLLQMHDEGDDDDDDDWPLYYYFDGRSSHSWPTHDPCGNDSRQPGVQGVADPRGSMYVR